MIKFVYFDVGGTLILDFSGTDNWEKLKNEIGIRKSDFQKFDNFWDSIERKINTNLDIEDLKVDIELKFGANFPDNYSFLVDGFVKKFRQNKSIWKVVKEVQKTHIVGLLTNMYPNMLKKIKMAGLLPEVDWDMIIDSSVVLMQKPDKEIYKLAEQKCGFKGEEIFFIDNSEKNIEAANKVGWNTFLYNPNNPENSSNELLKYYFRISN